MVVTSWWMQLMITYILQMAALKLKKTIKLQVWEHRQSLEQHQTLLINKTVSNNTSGPQDKLPYTRKNKIRSAMASRRFVERKNRSQASGQPHSDIKILLRSKSLTLEMGDWENLERAILN